MSKIEFRLLNADEIVCRPQQISKDGTGVSLLLYKDARCDMNILDECVGSMNWQRMHLRDNSNCIVSIWDADKNEWVSKEDTGTESFSEAEKGLASDSFKRACFNWGIGRELYTSPSIWINLNKADTKMVGDKLVLANSFNVLDVHYCEKRIIHLVIVDKHNKIRFSYGKPLPEIKTLVLDFYAGDALSYAKCINKFGIKTIDELTDMQMVKIYFQLINAKRING